MNLSLKKRDAIVMLLTYEFSLPYKFIQGYKTGLSGSLDPYPWAWRRRQFPDEVLFDMARQINSLPISLKRPFSSNKRETLNVLRQTVEIWLFCIEYNAFYLPKDSQLFTVHPALFMTNDLFHIYKRKIDIPIRGLSTYGAVPIPKLCFSGEHQWQKHFKFRLVDFPVIDTDGVLTTDDAMRRMRRHKREQYQQFCMENPENLPVQTSYSRQAINRILLDYIKYRYYGLLPSQIRGESIVGIDRSELKEILFHTNPPSKRRHWKCFVKQCRRVMAMS